ncbi:hypothetical protein GCM10022280_16280 [Sphingomonas swuensis]|uniref:Nucleotidyltransferase family protein n=1 Tax=Sphingomonas swuensis TaxID=977800 RepID=A0ABP7SXR2_9SPHN
MEPSLTLLIACCRFGYEGGESDGLRRLLKDADGARLSELARRHRVEGVVWRALKACSVMLPGTAPLAADSQKIAADGLRMAVESGRLTAAFARASLPHLFLKGQALGRLAWGDPLIKRQIDIDLLVMPQGIAKAATVLAGLGYVQELPDPSVDPSDWHRSHKESVWRNDDGIMLDLHSRVADHPGLLPQVAATMSPVMVPIVGAISLPTLPDRLRLPYLAVHGTSSAWFRLKWLAEFAALVHQLSPAALDTLADEAPRLGAGRTVTAALALSHRLFGTRVPENLWVDGGAAKIVKLSLAQIENPREPTERRFGTLGIHRAQLLMAPGSHFFLSELWRQLGAALIR